MDQVRARWQVPIRTRHVRCNVILAISRVLFRYRRIVTWASGLGLLAWMVVVAYAVFFDIGLVRLLAKLIVPFGAWGILSGLVFLNRPQA